MKQNAKRDGYKTGHFGESMETNVRSFPLTPAASFQAGVNARSSGKPKSANPYPPLCEHHDEWLEGWAATYDLDEDIDPCSFRTDDALDDRVGM